jgi:uncharacterized membrane protein
MVVAMLAMLELCVRVRAKSETGNKQRNFLGNYNNLLNFVIIFILFATFRYSHHQAFKK